MARFILDRSSVNRAAEQAARDELRVFARQVENRAKILAPVDTGRLRSSIRSSQGTVGGNPSARIESNVDYAAMVHDGTRPHVIRPRRKRALRFQVGGRIVFATRVNHPGTRPRPFLTRALFDVARQRGSTVREDGVD